MPPPVGWARHPGQLVDNLQPRVRPPQPHLHMSGLFSVRFTNLAIRKFYLLSVLNVYKTFDFGPLRLTLSVLAPNTGP